MKVRQFLIGLPIRSCITFKLADSWKYKKFLENGLPMITQCRILMHKRYIAVENTVRKGEIACNKQFLLFSQCFLPYMALIFEIKCTLN